MTNGVQNIRFKKAYLWLKFLLIFALTVAILVLTALSPLFNISSIEVIGNGHYEERDIVEASGIVAGSNGFKTIGNSFINFFTLRYGNAEERILKLLPYIKDVEARFIIPSTVRINVSERKPMAAVPYLGTNLIIDDEGYVLDTVVNSDSGLPAVKGLKFEDFELGQALKVDNRKSLDQVIKLMKAIYDSDMNDKFKLGEIIDSIDASAEDKICVFIDSRIVANLGSLENLNYRISVLKHVLLKNLKKEDKGLLDFTVGQNPVFMPDAKVSDN